MAVGAALLLRPAAATVGRPPTPDRRKRLLARPRLRPCAQQRQIPQKEAEVEADASRPRPRPRRRVSHPSAAGLLDRIRGDEIGLQILNIALPAALALAADPITSLVDTAFVGHLGSVELAAVGVSVSVFNLVSKLFNIPLLNVTTSFVAEQQALECDINPNVSEDEASDVTLGKIPAEGRKFLPAVTTSLVLAAGFGIAEAIALICGSGLLLNFMGFTYAFAS